MNKDEVFPNPTVKQVIFQIRFPNLFYIENKIGEFQLEIMNEFPESSLLLQRQLAFIDAGQEVKIEDVSKEMNKEGLKKIWQFKSNKNYKLNVLSDSLDISSEYHKTYNNPGGGDKFRDKIKFVLDRFFKITGLQIVNRVGLRYIDECPIIKKDSDIFKSYYNSVFPVDRFNLMNADRMDFSAIVKKENYKMCYKESLNIVGDSCSLILDFDGFINGVAAIDCMNHADKLHEIISNEYNKTIKEPVREYMRRKKEV